ncbi:MAG: hypothetical protein AB7N76_20165 [Planctomycetota bacterium]
MIVAGFDEAGYGPTLGPLVVGYTAFEVPEQDDDPCLWTALGDAVRGDAPPRKGNDARVWVADSKAIKPRKDGLRQLELGVLCFAGRREATTLGALLRDLGADAALGGQEWFRDLDAVRVPAHAWPGEVATRAERLEQAGGAVGVRFLGAEVRALDARSYNDRIAATQNKAAVLEEACVSLLRSLRRKHAGRLSVTLDKHGGRSTYLRLLGRAFPMCALEIEVEGPEESAYTTETPEGPVRCVFRQGAEEASLATALASMHCKYLRERLMERFNAWFLERVPGVRPTAGYALDAKRFLAEVEPDLDRLGVAREDLVRAR